MSAEFEMNEIRTNESDKLKAIYDDERNGSISGIITISTIGAQRESTSGIQSHLCVSRK